MCIFCFKTACSEKDKRHVTMLNYTQLGVTDKEFTMGRNRIICSTCRMSRIILKDRKKFPTLNCTTPRRKVKLRELRLSDKEEHIVQEKI